MKKKKKFPVLNRRIDAFETEMIIRFAGFA